MIEYVITITIILTILSVGLFHCKNLLVHNNSFWDKKIIIHSSVMFWIVKQRYIFPKNWSYETQNRKEKGLWFFSSWTNWFTVLAIMAQRMYYALKQNFDLILSCACNNIWRCLLPHKNPVLFFVTKRKM